MSHQYMADIIRQTSMRSEDQIQTILQQQPDLSKFGNSYEQACLFYFGLLRELDLKVITTSIEIQNIALSPEKSKLEMFHKSANTAKNKQDVHKNQAFSHALLHQQPPQLPLNPNQLQCKVKGCYKIFDRKSALQVHEILRHKTPANEWMNNRIFNIEIKEIAESRRGSRNQTYY